MYICDNCGNVFENPRTWREERSGDGWAYETMTSSPCCDDSYSEAVPCQCCGMNLIPDTQDYCKECERALNMIMENAQAELGADFDVFYNMVLEWTERNY